MVMNVVLDRVEKKKFQCEDFVLWHYRAENYILPIPGVVVCHGEDGVTIRVRVDGKVRELTVEPEELTTRY